MLKYDFDASYHLLVCQSLHMKRVWSNPYMYIMTTTLPHDHNITENGLLEQIKFLVDNIYIQVGNKIVDKQ